MLDEIFQAVRAAAPADVWSRGVELVRADAVHAENVDDEEVRLRVATRGGLVSPAVTLYLVDTEWDCDCGAAGDVCPHVAASVIALRRARKEGSALPGEQGASGRIGYRLTREGGGLALERVVVRGESEQRLATTLVAVASGRVDGPRFVATSEDIEIERTLGGKRSGRQPRGVLHELLPHLARCRDVTLDGEPIGASAEPIGFTALVEDDGPGLRLRVAREHTVDEVFDDTLALSGGALRPLGAAGLLGSELRAFTGSGRAFAPDEAAKLVTEVLPELEQKMPVEVRTRRLPRAVREKPALRIQASRNGDALELLPTLVYGDPPRARVDAGRLVPLRDGPLPLRDEEAERRLTRNLAAQLELAPGRRVAFVAEAAVRMAAKLARFDAELEGDAHRGFVQVGSLEPEFSVTGSDFALRFTTGDGGSEREGDPARVLAAWRRGESLVPLTGGGFAELPSAWLERHGERVADLLAARAVTDDLPPALLPDLAALCAELDQPPPPGLARLTEVLDPSGDVRPAALPADLTATLRDYQRRGVDWLCALRDAGLGALLADDMGLGKTLQALCAVRGRTLVVCPTSVLPNWAAEAARFRPELRCHTYHGANRALDADADVTFTTYALLRIDANTLIAEDWDSVVLDEAQNVKNPESQAARAAFRLRADFKLALTGTPVENRLDELWSQMHFANPGLLGGRADFDERVARPIGAGDDGAAVRLRQRIRPFLLRRLKREVAPELPPRTECVLYAELGEPERAVYDGVRAATREDVVQRLREGGSVLGALEALLRLRQACCHPALVPGQQADGSAKLDVLLETLEEAVAEGHKALVFSQWTSLLDLAEPALRDAAIDTARLDGSTRDRGGVVARFQADDGPPVLLVSLKAGGTGLNLTAADHVFILDPWWNPAVEDQAADRAHRIGQDRPVLVHRLVARNTVEERILELQRKKRALADAALGDGGAAAGLTRDDLLALLE